MRRALAKPHPRVLGLDDGAFRRGDRAAPIAAVVLSAPDYVESVAVGRVTVDGADGTDRVLALIRRAAPSEGIRAVLLDGPVVGGFNVLDLDRLHAAVGVPVVALTRRPPDFARIRAAVTRWFPRDARRRIERLERYRLVRIPTDDAPLWAARVGCTARDAAWLVRRTTVRGHWPEPLRLAHLVASAAAASEPLRGVSPVRRAGL